MVGLHERRRPLGRPRRRFHDNIEKTLKTWTGEAETAFTWSRIGAGGEFW